MKLTLELAVLSAFNIAAALAFQWYVVVTLGAGVSTDALFAGMAIPTVVLTIVSGSVTHVLVPLLVDEAPDDAKRDAWTLLLLISGIFLLISGLLFWSAASWIPFFVKGFDDPAQLLTLELTRIQLVSMVFTAANGVQWAVYHAKRQFIWGEVSQLLSAGAAFVLLVYLLPIYGVTAVAWLAVFRALLQTILLMPGMGWPCLPDFRSSAISESWLRLRPLLLGSAYFKTDVLVDRVLLSFAASGSLTLFHLAQRLYGAAGQVFSNAMCAPAVPQLTSLYKHGDADGFRRAYHRNLTQIALVSAVLLLLLIAIGEPVFNLLLRYGSFTQQSVETLWWILVWLGGMFFGSGTGQLCASTFYAMGDTRTPTRLSVVTYTIYIPVKIAAFLVAGVPGLAISTSVYYLANLFLQMFLLERRFNHVRV